MFSIDMSGFGSKVDPTYDFALNRKQRKQVDFLESKGLSTEDIKGIIKQDPINCGKALKKACEFYKNAKNLSPVSAQQQARVSSASTVVQGESPPTIPAGTSTASTRTPAQAPQQIELVATAPAIEYSLEQLEHVRELESDPRGFNIEELTDVLGVVSRQFKSTKVEELVGDLQEVTGLIANPGAAARASGVLKSKLRDGFFQFSVKQLARLLHKAPEAINQGNFERLLGLPRIIGAKNYQELAFLAGYNHLDFSSLTIEKVRSHLNVMYAGAPETLKEEIANYQKDVAQCFEAKEAALHFSLHNLSDEQLIQALVASELVEKGQSIVKKVVEKHPGFLRFYYELPTDKELRGSSSTSLWECITSSASSEQ